MAISSLVTYSTRSCRFLALHASRGTNSHIHSISFPSRNSDCGSVFRQWFAQGIAQHASQSGSSFFCARTVLRRSLHICKNGMNQLMRPPNLYLGIGSLTLGTTSLYKVWSTRALCDSLPRKTRLVGSTDAGSKEANFPWSEFLQYLWPDIWYLLGAVVSALAVAFVNIQVPLLLGDVVNVLTSSSSTTSDNNFLQDIKVPALKLVYMYGIQGILTSVYIALLGAAGERTAARLRNSLFHAIITHDIEFFDTHKTGEIINRLTSDIQDFKSSFKLCISQGLKSFTQTLGCVVSLYMMSKKLTLLMLVVVPSVIAAGSLLGSGLRTLSRAAQTQVAKATAVADEAIGNVRTVRAFAMEEKEMELYSQEVEAASRLNQTLAVGIGLFQGVSNVALNGIVLGTLYVGGLLMSRQEIKAGDLMSFMVAVQTVQRSLAQMSLLFGQAVRGLSSGSRIFEYIHLRGTIPTTGGETIPYHTMRGEVEFKDISFSYPSRPDQVVLKDFSLRVPGGRMVALVGLSGGGKSTVASLLERFYDVDKGTITVDGKDITSLDPSWLRGRAIGFINQEPILFATSVMENIRYGRPDATDEEVYEAAKMANAASFIESFPEGYATVLGERGVTVSGGQKQRIAIARALIKRPSLLLLDEATSALDAESERVVQEALDNVVKGRTVLVIAHRLSTIRNADVIAVVAEGQIAEMGTHDELRKRKGLYWNLIKKQESEDHLRQKNSSAGMFSRFSEAG